MFDTYHYENEGKNNCNNHHNNHNQREIALLLLWRCRRGGTCEAIKEAASRVCAFECEASEVSVVSTIANTFSRYVPMRNQCCNNRKHAHGKGITVHVDNIINLL